MKKATRKQKLALMSGAEDTIRVHQAAQILASGSLSSPFRLMGAGSSESRSQDRSAQYTDAPHYTSAPQPMYPPSGGHHYGSSYMGGPGAGDPRMSYGGPPPHHPSSTSHGGYYTSSSPYPCATQYEYSLASADFAYSGALPPYMNQNGSYPAPYPPSYSSYGYRRTSSTPMPPVEYFYGAPPPAPGMGARGMDPRWGDYRSAPPPASASMYPSPYGAELPIYAAPAPRVSTGASYHHPAPHAGPAPIPVHGMNPRVHAGAYAGRHAGPRGSLRAGVNPSLMAARPWQTTVVRDTSVAVPMGVYKHSNAAGPGPAKESSVTSNDSAVDSASSGSRTGDSGATRTLSSASGSGGSSDEYIHKTESSITNSPEITSGSGSDSS